MESLGNDQPDVSFDKVESDIIDEPPIQHTIEDYPASQSDQEASDNQDGLAEQFGMFYD